MNSELMVTCPSCNGSRWRPALEVEDHRYVACVACGLARLDPLPTADDLASMYDESYFNGSTTGGYHDYLADEAIHRRNARRHLARLDRLVGAARGPLIELGSAGGFLLDEARTDGWSVTGVEIAPIADHARQVLGLGVVADLDDAVEADGSCGAAVVNQVLEHLVDPAAALDTISRALRPGGVLTIETWNRSSLIARCLGRRWQQITPPSVVWLFRNEDLRRMLERAGFVSVRARRATKWVSVATVLGQAAEGDGLLRRLAASRVGRVALPYHLGDLVVVTAVRV